MESNLSTEGNVSSASLLISKSSTRYSQVLWNCLCTRPHQPLVAKSRELIDSLNINSHTTRYQPPLAPDLRCITTDLTCRLGKVPLQKGSRTSEALGLFFVVHRAPLIHTRLVRDGEGREGTETDIW